MPITLAPIKAARGSRIPLEETDPDVKEAVDSAFEYCQKSDERLEGNFGTREAAEAFLFAARSYAYQHDPRLVVVGNPTNKGLARFRVELFVASETPEAAETSEA